MITVRPLQMASGNGHLEIVKTLLAAKAEMNKSDGGGETALAIAPDRNHYDVAAVLREAGGQE